ncbi:MAG: hypothetical protein LBP29_00840 [Treponema sp.]|jgi:hypothetical protein|nr:hypothetical protein [Treponema sp.]
MNLGKIFAGKKERENAERNRKRLEGALETLRRLKFLRVADEDIKNRIVRLCYEAGAYIAFALKSPDAFYDPPLVDSLEKSLASVNVFFKEENDDAADRIFYGGAAKDSITLRDRVIALLEESAGAFREKNEINSSGDLDRIITEMDDRDDGDG